VSTPNVQLRCNLIIQPVSAGRIVWMYSKDELIAALDSGEKIKWIHFWGHQPQQDGSLGSGCLSQWWPSPFTVEGIEYATAEHWMMVEKAKLFHDDSAVAAILAAPSPAAAKALGQKVAGFDEAAWTASRFDIVVRGNAEMFASSDALRAYLIGTGHRVLVEASPVGSTCWVLRSCRHVQSWLRKGEHKGLFGLDYVVVYRGLRELRRRSRSHRLRKGSDRRGRRRRRRSNSASGFGAADAFGCVAQVGEAIVDFVERIMALLVDCVSPCSSGRNKLGDGCFDAVNLVQRSHQCRSPIGAGHPHRLHEFTLSNHSLVNNALR
jgi:ribA/ribD-fused uncharacterized protein